MLHPTSFDERRVTVLEPRDDGSKSKDKFVTWLIDRMQVYLIRIVDVRIVVEHQILHLLKVAICSRSEQFLALCLSDFTLAMN